MGDSKTVKRSTIGWIFILFGLSVLLLVVYPEMSQLKGENLKKEQTDRLRVTPTVETISRESADGLLKVGTQTGILPPIKAAVSFKRTGNVNMLDVEFEVTGGMKAVFIGELPVGTQELTYVLDGNSYFVLKGEHGYAEEFFDFGELKLTIIGDCFKFIAPSINSEKPEIPDTIPLTVCF